MPQFNTIQEAVAAIQRGNPPVEEVEFGARARVGDPEMAALAAAMKESKTVTSLVLAHRTVGVVGARALAEAIRVSKLETLDLVMAGIDDEGAKALAEAMK